MRRRLFGPCCRCPGGRTGVDHALGYAGRDPLWTSARVRRDQVDTGDPTDVRDRLNPGGPLELGDPLSARAPAAPNGPAASATGADT